MFWSTHKIASGRSTPAYRVRFTDWLRYAGHAHAFATFRFLLELSVYRMRLVATESPMGSAWLLPFRNDFHHIIQNDGNGFIVWRFLREGDQELRPIYVWLLSHFANRFQLMGIDKFARSDSAQLRKHVAKALRKLEAWKQLQQMVTAYPGDDTVWDIQTSLLVKRPFRERLQHFAADVDTSSAAEVKTPSQMPYWTRDTDWTYTAPKSGALIRRILKRIRHWVRWGVA